MKRGTSRPERRIFWFSLGIALFIFITLIGLVTVDYQGRKLSFGDTTPPLSLTHEGRPTLRVKALGVDASLDAEKLDKLLDFFCDFACLPRR